MEIHLAGGGGVDVLFRLYLNGSQKSENTFTIRTDAAVALA